MSTVPRPAPDRGRTRPGAEIMPFALVRLAALPYPPDPAASFPFREAMSELVDREAELAAIAKPLADLLHDSAGTHSVEFHRKVALPLRRDVHNGRCPKPALLASLDDLPERIPLLARWLAAQDTREAAGGEVIRLWPSALAAEREMLAGLCAAEPLRRAAVLSGRDLSHGLDRVATAGAEPDRKARKAEPTVLRFALRATSKTSPLSWYTAVGWGVWSPRAQDPPAATPVAYTRANQVLVSRLTAAVLSSRRHRLPHRLAPAVRQRDGRVTFERDVPVDGATRAYLTTAETVELAVTGPLRFLIEAAVQASPKGASPTELIAALAARLPDGQEAHATRYVEKLVDIGLLIPVAPIDPQDPDALEALAGWLRDTGDNVLAGELTALACRTTAFAGLEVRDRAPAIAELERSWRSVGESTGANLTGVPPLTEDVVLPGRVDLGPGHATGTLARLTPLLMLFDRQLLIRRIARDRFVQRFGTGGSAHPADCADLLQSALVAALTISPDTAGELGELLAARTRLAELVRSANPKDAVDRDIPDAVIDAAEKALPRWARARPVSYALFVQPIPGNGLVVNHIYAGFGRFASRFLDWLPTEATAAITAALGRVFDGRGWTQFRPVAGFNPNLHPMLTGREIGEDPRWADLPLDRLTVCHDPEQDEIRLRLRDSGELLDVLYLGFLMPNSLPDRFTALYSDLACGWADLAELKSTVDYSGVPMTGRLRYRDVVLSRRSWEFDGEELRAELTGAEPETALAVARLRARHGLPGQVFVGAGGGITSRADFEARLAAAKPQYVDLANALHLRCLPRVLSRYTGQIQVTEALPVPGGQVVEWIAESYRRAT